MSRRHRGERLIGLRIPKGPDSGPLPGQQGSGVELHLSDRGSGAQLLFSAFDPERESLVDEAAALFSRHYGRAFSREEARQAMNRLTAFFTLLAAWDQQKRVEPLENDRAA